MVKMISCCIFPIRAMFSEGICLHVLRSPLFSLHLVEFPSYFTKPEMKVLQNIRDLKTTSIYGKELCPTACPVISHNVIHAILPNFWLQLKKVKGSTQKYGIWWSSCAFTNPRASPPPSVPVCVMVPNLLGPPPSSLKLADFFPSPPMGPLEFRCFRFLPKKNSPQIGSKNSMKKTREHSSCKHPGWMNFLKLSYTCTCWEHSLRVRCEMFFIWLETWLQTPHQLSIRLFHLIGAIITYWKGYLSGSQIPFVTSHGPLCGIFETKMKSVKHKNNCRGASDCGGSPPLYKKSSAIPDTSIDSNEKWSLVEVLYKNRDCYYFTTVTVFRQRPKDTYVKLASTWMLWLISPSGVHVSCQQLTQNTHDSTRWGPY